MLEHDLIVFTAYGKRAYYICKELAINQYELNLAHYQNYEQDQVPKQIKLTKQGRQLDSSPYTDKLVQDQLIEGVEAWKRG